MADKNNNTHLVAIFQDNSISELQNVSISRFCWIKNDGGGGDAVSQKRCRLFSFCNLKKLQLIIIFFCTLYTEGPSF